MTAIERLQKRTDEPDEAVLADMLESAKSIILSRRFPYGEWPTKKVTDEDGNETEETYVEPQYQDLQYRIALAIYNKDGGDYETSHSENGVTRVWGSEAVPQELLEEITPYVGVLR